MRKLVALTALVSVLVSNPAMAIGNVERGVLYGLAGYWTFQQLNRIGQQAPQAPQPTVTAPPAYTTTRPALEPLYKAVDVFIPECNCYRTIMVQIN